MEGGASLPCWQQAHTAVAVLGAALPLGGVPPGRAPHGPRNLALDQRSRARWGRR